MPTPFSHAKYRTKQPNNSPAYQLINSKNKRPPAHQLKKSRHLQLINVSIQYPPSFSDMFCFLPLCKKICLHSTKQMFTVFVVLLLICVRESSAYVNSYVGMTSTLLTAVSMCFITALAIASNCSIGNVVALLCITSRWRRVV